MKAAHGDLNAGIAERARNIERARILVRLHADQSEQAKIAVLAETAEQLRDIHPRMGLVDDVDVDGDVRPEHLALRGIARQPVDRGEGIGGDQRAPPADHIAVVVIVRRLDQDELEATFHRWLGGEHAFSDS